MNSGDAPHSQPQNEAAVAEASFQMNTFQWLIVLGFPTNVAAAQTMPELFTADDAVDSAQQDQVLSRRLQIDRALASTKRCA